MRVPTSVVAALSTNLCDSLWVLAQACSLLAQVPCIDGCHIKVVKPLCIRQRCQRRTAPKRGRKRMHEHEKHKSRVGINVNSTPPPLNNQYTGKVAYICRALLPFAWQPSCASVAPAALLVAPAKSRERERVSECVCVCV